MKSVSNPAEYVIGLLGGGRPAGKKLGLSSGTCNYWLRVGYVPAKNIPAVLKYCAKHGIEIDMMKLVPR